MKKSILFFTISIYFLLLTSCINNFPSEHYLNGVKVDEISTSNVAKNLSEWNELALSNYSFTYTVYFGDSISPVWIIKGNVVVNDGVATVTFSSPTEETLSNVEEESELKYSTVEDYVKEQEKYFLSVNEIFSYLSSQYATFLNEYDSKTYISYSAYVKYDDEYHFPSIIYMDYNELGCVVGASPFLDMKITDFKIE